jgi:chorismate mutase
MVPPFAWLSAASQGTSHVLHAIPCQDAVAVTSVVAPDGVAWLVAALADGAGSVPMAKEGAEAAVLTFTTQIVEHITAASPLDAQRLLRSTFQATRDHLEALAAKADRPIHDYSATLLAVLTDGRTTACLQIGDGAIVIRDDQFRAVFRPQHGEYSNITHFLTDPDAADRVMITASTTPWRAIFLFSDGLESLFLERHTLKVCSPYLARVALALDEEPEGGERLGLSEEVTSVLSSADIMSRTDDDVSLIAIVPRLPATTRPNP